MPRKKYVTYETSTGMTIQVDMTGKEEAAFCDDCYTKRLKAGTVEFPMGTLQVRQWYEWPCHDCGSFETRHMGTIKSEQCQDCGKSAELFKVLQNTSDGIETRWVCKDCSENY